MKIVADENIPLLEAFFSDLGEIVTLPGRAITAADVRDADVLLVRSVTRVDASLLEGSAVRFVGTATIGTDHLDTAWLQSKGIRFFNAPGCNADSVVEHVLSALVYLDTFQDFDWLGKRYGIIGHGQIGSRLAQVLSKLGCDVRVNDPPLESQGGSGLCSLDEVLACDVISLHVPMIREGEHPTWHLIGESELARMQPGTLLINTSRGGVVDDQALLHHVKTGKIQAVLDVFEEEPELPAELVRHTALATPHVAGYSLDGKCRGTEMVYQALCTHLGLPVRRKLGQFLPEPAWRKVSLGQADDIREVARHLVTACHDIRRDDRALRAALGEAERLPASEFDRLRKQYPVRRSFGRTRLELKGPSKSLAVKLEALGFRVKPD